MGCFGMFFENIPPHNQTSVHQQGNQDDDELSNYESVSDTPSAATHPNTRVRGRGIYSS